MTRPRTRGIGRSIVLCVLMHACAPWVVPPSHTPAASVGAPANGYLIRPLRLAPRGDGYESFRTAAEGAQLFGTPRLVHGIRHAARVVRVHNGRGAPLRVGDLSAPDGGRIERHRSHRNGRDVDLLFYALDDATGRSVPAPAFVRYDATGRSLDPAYPLRFDTARNWWLVEALAGDPDAAVIRIFCARWLHTLLIDWAVAHHRPIAVIDRVRELLLQPGDSAAHDDHFHVRVACTPDERARGCADGSPIAWWLEREWSESLSATMDDDALLAALADAPPTEAPPLPQAPVRAPRPRARSAQEYER